MSTIHDGLSSLLQMYRQIQTQTAESMKRLGSGKKVTHPKIDPGAWREIASYTSEAKRLEGFSENLTAAGISVRVAGAAMDAMDQHLGILEENLTSAAAAVPGSAERRENLREYNRILAVMTDLSKPPDPGARRLLGDPAVVPDAGDIAIRAADDFSFTLRHQPIHLGAEGLNVSPIADPETATREDIEAAIEAATRARAELVTKRKGLSADASAIARSERFNTLAIQQNLNHADRLNIPDLNREAVLVQSLSMQSSLAIHGLSSLNQTHAWAVQLLP